MSGVRMTPQASGPNRTARSGAVVVTAASDRVTGM
jgi:hypothetical protein